MNNINNCQIASQIRSMLSPSSSDSAPGVLVVLGEELFIFMKLESTDNYFRGAGEQAHKFWD